MQFKAVVELHVGPVDLPRCAQVASCLPRRRPRSVRGPVQSGHLKSCRRAARGSSCLTSTSTALAPSRQIFLPSHCPHHHWFISLCVPIHAHVMCVCVRACVHAYVCVFPYLLNIFYHFLNFVLVLTMLVFVHDKTQQE